MSVNGVTTTNSTYETYKPATSTAAANTEATTGAAKTEDVAAVYEASDSKNTAAKQPVYKQNTELINKLKAEAEARTQQLQNIVAQLLNKQGTAFTNANDMWSYLASGKLEVDEATRKQAEEDVSEDGYWGVKQTSERILDFATALTGGDPSKIEEMREAFIKGYKQAEKTWGGELPEISKQTYEAVMKGFDKMAEEAGITTNVVAKDPVTEETTEN